MIGEENFIVPKHIGFIMDGNRRWAKSKGLSIKEGYMEGINSLKRVLECAKIANVEYLTVYAFSTENWKRNENEIAILMDIFLNCMEDLLKEDRGFRVIILGDKTPFSNKLKDKMMELEEKTKNNKYLTLGICLNYSGRSDIIQAVKNIANLVVNEELNVNDIDENIIKEKLYTKDFPYPDIIVRTSGEYRTSDFLSWQSAYSELYFINKNWPDFIESDFDKVILEYSKRNRRYGK